MAIIYASFISQYKFKYRTSLSARFHKQDENGQILDELINNTKKNRNLM